MVHDIDKELDNLLAKRAVPEMRSNLEHRIINAALQQEQGVIDNESAQGLWGVLKTVLDNIVLPQPALAMIMVLAIGVTIGVYSPDITQTGEGESIEAYIMVIDDIEYGELL